MRLHGIVGLALLLIPAFVGPAFLQAQPGESPGLYIAIGDSIAAGVGSSLPRERSYPAILTGWISALAGGDASLANLGRPGETAATFIADGQLDEFRGQVSLAQSGNVPIRVVTVSLGGNEILAIANSGITDRQAALDEFEANLDSALAEVRSAVGPDVPVILTNSYDPTAGNPQSQFSDSWWIARFNDAIAAVAERHGGLVADVYAAFEGDIDTFTHYPADVHPTNRGYRAIARQIWSSLDFDTEAPVVEVRSPERATRPTPTLRFSAVDNVGVADVGVLVGDETVVAPLERPDGEWVALLNLSGSSGDTVEVEIIVTDEAGNVTTVTHMIQLDFG